MTKSTYHPIRLRVDFAALRECAVLVQKEEERKGTNEERIPSLEAKEEEREQKSG